MQNVNFHPHQIIANETLNLESFNIKYQVFGIDKIHILKTLSTSFVDIFALIAMGIDECFFF